MTKGWGTPERYYAEGTSQKNRQLNWQEQEIGRLVEKRFPNIESRVERAFKESNALIREHLRSETGFKLSIDDKRQSIPVKVVNGIPEVLLRTLDFDPEVMELYLDLSLLKTTVRGLERTAVQYPFLSRWPQMTGNIAPLDELKHSHETIEHLCRELDKIKILEPVWKIDEDVMGAYFFQQRRIELYWIPIGLIAADLDVSPEALTQVVAVHELAHAYTHLGFDIDDYYWETHDFAMTSPYVVEGIAQFFTSAVCRRMENRYSEAPKAYRALLEKQSGPYKAHLGWIDEDEAGGEAVRNALITFRSRNEYRHEDFINRINHHKELIGKRIRSREESKKPHDYFEF